MHLRLLLTWINALPDQFVRRINLLALVCFLQDALQVTLKLCDYLSASFGSKLAINRRSVIFVQVRGINAQF